MRARIKVLPKSAQVPSAATDKKAADKQVARTIAELKRNLRRKDAAGNVVEAGRDTRDTELLGFYPAKKTVPVGTTFEQPALVDVARELVDAGAEPSRVSKRSIQSTRSLSV